ncbi:dihydrodipicolinate synthase family protein [Streptomyces sp. NPDC057545]|uniref:dihydrodipicolinate synthase family protein n=1 Tax=unclassified Streptomyces TaxID=2593676 RepID=UPI0036A34F2C
MRPAARGGRGGGPSRRRGRRPVEELRGNARERRGQLVGVHGAGRIRRARRHRRRRLRFALARQAERAGADGLLVVAPYYSRPPQAAVETYFRRVADATGLPLMLYDIPDRTGIRVEPETLLRLAGHPRVVAVKDCAYDLLGSTKVIGATSLAYYSGCDELNLPLYAVGAAGCVSTVANVAPRQLRALLDAFDAGNTAEAARLNRLLTPLTELMTASGLPGTVTAKALLGAGPVREPLQPAGRGATDGLRRAYEELLTTTGRCPSPAPVP